ncbi:hypothetical protein Tsp_15994, partial [Trichinella spiralis]|uniref:hypothetical protein n=1 Tax=Trichinella spiralis TaxID=6334 RepID=UPI0001EFD8EE
IVPQWNHNCLPSCLCGQVGGQQSIVYVWALIDKAAVLEVYLNPVSRYDFVFLSRSATNGVNQRLSNQISPLALRRYSFVANKGCYFHFCLMDTLIQQVLSET